MCIFLGALMSGGRNPKDFDLDEACRIAKIYLSGHGTKISLGNELEPKITYMTVLERETEYVDFAKAIQEGLQAKINNLNELAAKALQTPDKVFNYSLWRAMVNGTMRGIKYMKKFDIKNPKAALEELTKAQALSATGLDSQMFKALVDSITKLVEITQVTSIHDTVKKLEAMAEEKK